MTLANFLTYVKQDFKRTDKDTEITQAYNDSIIAISAKMPHGAYKYTSYTNTVDGQVDYPLPCNSMHISHPVKILEGNASTDSGWQLEHITKEEFDFLEPNPFRTSPDSKGDPVKYCIHSRSIMLTPIPDDSDHIIEIDWTKVPTDQSAVTDTPALPDHWREVLKQMTLSRLHQGLGLYQEAQYWRNLYEDPRGDPVGLYKSLLDMENDREDTAVGTITPNYL